MNKTVIILLIVLLSLLVSKVAFADEQRLQTEFTSQNKEYTIEITKGNKWRLKNKQGKVLYSIKDEKFTSMTVMVSNDGKAVVVIDDFSEVESVGKIKALWFYYNGEFKKSYQLKELVNDTCNVSRTVWHTLWCLPDFGFLSDNSALQLSTFEFNDFQFSVQTGDLISKQRPEGFTSETVIVYGSFRKGKNEEVNMKVYKYIVGNGKPEDTIRFRTKYYGEGPWNAGVMIREGEEITPLRYRRVGLAVGGSLKCIMNNKP